MGQIEQIQPATAESGVDTSCSGRGRVSFGCLVYDGGTLESDSKLIRQGEHLYQVVHFNEYGMQPACSRSQSSAARLSLLLRCAVVISPTCAAG